MDYGVLEQTPGPIQDGEVPLLYPRSLSCHFIIAACRDRTTGAFTSLSSYRTLVLGLYTHSFV